MNTTAQTSIFKHIIFFFIILTINIFAVTNLYAIEIRHAEIIGSTVELEMEGIVKNIKGEYSEKDIEAIGIKITDEYHNMGYTTSYVEKLHVSKNGILQIRVKESKIVAVNISGDSGKEKSEIEARLNSLIGVLYNKYELQKAAESIKREYNLNSMQIYPVNYENSDGDVFLSIKLTKKSRGNLYGGIDFEPIYGISPYAGYFYPFTDTVIDLYAKAGYREGKFRKTEGDIKFFMFPDKEPIGFYIGSNAAMLLEYFESIDRDYRTISISPVLGYRAVYQYLILDLFVNEIISEIYDYESENEKIRNYDSRITLELEITDRTNLLSKKDATSLKLTASSGKTDFRERLYLISSAEFKSPLKPVTWLRITPSLYSYYTTMDERFYWQYVYDKRQLGFYNDYTASKWKNTAGLDLEFEMVPQFFYTGPFVNTGYFKDESMKWKSKTGGGIMGVFEFKSSYIGIYFAWDLSKGPSQGGISIIAGGSF